MMQSDIQRQYNMILQFWQSKDVHTAADLDLEMNGNGAKFIYHNGKIENEKITYHDTREIYDHGGVTSYTGDVRTLFEIQNLCAGYQRFLTAFANNEPLDEALVLELHSILTQGTYDMHRYEIGERPGSYKKHDYVTGVDEVGALPEDVQEEMSELLAEISDITDEQALTAAAYLHAKLENIHPFADGNGRVGRLLMNYLLVTHHHPPIIIFEEDRKAYYNALETYDRSLDLEPLKQFLRMQTCKTWQQRMERQQLSSHGAQKAETDLSRQPMADRFAAAKAQAEQHNSGHSTPDHPNHEPER